jgi:cysteine-rich repeat protein
MRNISLTIAASLLAACSSSAEYHCSSDGECNLAGDGHCWSSPDESRTCAYPDTACSTGFHWTIDGPLDNVCVESNALPDAAVTDALMADCTFVRCGDGITNVAAGETCDDGASNGIDKDCTPNCQRNVCGDGMVDKQGPDIEDCDDGNRDDDRNGCGTACKFNNVCGNNHVEQLAEQCDDGDAVDTRNGCSALCQQNNVCGNGHPEGLFEQCDDGNNRDGDGCSHDCHVE